MIQYSERSEVQGSIVYACLGLVREVYSFHFQQPEIACLPVNVVDWTPEQVVGICVCVLGGGGWMEIEKV